MKIAIAGTGYVGLSLAVLLSQHNVVTAVDIDPEKVRLINEWKSPIKRVKVRACGGDGIAMENWCLKGITGLTKRTVCGKSGMPMASWVLKALINRANRMELGRSGIKTDC